MSTATSTDDPRPALAAQQAELAALTADLDDAQWAKPSRCEGWSAADVLLHLAQTNEMSIGSLRGTLSETLAALTDGLPPANDVDDGAAQMVTRERGESGPEVRARWLAGVEELGDLFASTDPHTRVTWVAGQLSAHTLCSTRLSETWIHTGDIAEAIGVQLADTDRLRFIARLAWRTLPYTFARAGRELAGPVAFMLEGLSGERWDFVPEQPAATTIRGTAADLCAVAARRIEPSATKLEAEGPDAGAVLELVRTYA